MALRKYSIICLATLLVVSSLIAGNSSGTLTDAKPSVPVFSLGLSNGLIDITIQNQKLILTTGNESIYYNIRVKDHFGDQWTELYTLYSTTMSIERGTIPIQSNEKYTILPCPVLPYPQNTTVDFQVQAMYGHYYVQEPASHSPFVPDIVAFNIVSESGWSSTQTITIPLPSPSVTESPPNFGPTSSPEPTIGELALALASVAIGISILCVVVLLFYVRHLKIKIATADKKS